MEAIRAPVDVQGKTVTIHLPDHFRGRRVEVIVLDAVGCVPEHPAPDMPRRRPSADLARTRITGDIMTPAALPEEWDALR